MSRLAYVALGYERENLAPTLLGASLSLDEAQSMARRFVRTDPHASHYTIERVEQDDLLDLCFAGYAAFR
jgi:hypothetical protein